MDTQTLLLTVTAIGSAATAVNTALTAKNTSDDGSGPPNPKKPPSN